MVKVADCHALWMPISIPGPGVALRRLQYLGVPLDGPAYMFGDNETVVNQASLPHAKLHKRHNMLSWHRTRAAIASGAMVFHHVKGKLNFADVLSKHWDYASVRRLLRPLLFWHGADAPLLPPRLEDEAPTAPISQSPVVDG